MADINIPPGGGPIIRSTSPVDISGVTKVATVTALTSILSVDVEIVSGIDCQTMPSLPSGATLGKYEINNETMYVMITNGSIIPFQIPSNSRVVLTRSNSRLYPDWLELESTNINSGVLEKRPIRFDADGRITPRFLDANGEYIAFGRDESYMNGGKSDDVTDLSHGLVHIPGWGSGNYCLLDHGVVRMHQAPDGKQYFPIHSGYSENPNLVFFSGLTQDTEGNDCQKFALRINNAIQDGFLISHPFRSHNESIFLHPGKGYISGKNIVSYVHKASKQEYVLWEGKLCTIPDFIAMSNSEIEKHSFQEILGIKFYIIGNTNSIDNIIIVVKNNDSGGYDKITRATSGNILQCKDIDHSLFTQNNGPDPEDIVLVGYPSIINQGLPGKYIIYELEGYYSISDRKRYKKLRNDKNKQYCIYDTSGAMYILPKSPRSFSIIDGVILKLESPGAEAEFIATDTHGDRLEFYGCYLQYTLGVFTWQILDSTTNSNPTLTQLKKAKKAFINYYGINDLDIANEQDCSNGTIEMDFCGNPSFLPGGHEK